MGRTKITKIIGVFAVFMLLFSSAFASPVIESFEIKFVYPEQMQLNWKISSDIGLARLEIFKDNELIYYERLSGTSYTSLYQTAADNKTHEFKIVAYDILNSSTAKLDKKERDLIAPKITSGATAVVSKNKFEFTTDEDAICKAGLFKNQLLNASTEFQKTHSISVIFNEGKNNVFVKCSDRENNEMGFDIVEVFLDTIKPGKVSNISYAVENNKTKLVWANAYDGSGISRYNIYNTLGLVGTTGGNSWDVTTEDSIFFISAVDKAGHEGDKAEYSLGRALLLKSDMEQITGAAVKKAETSSENTTSFFSKIFGKKDKSGQAAEKGKMFSPMAVAVLIVIGILVGVFIGWKIYDYKTDTHGLRRYLRQRMRLREQ